MGTLRGVGRLRPDVSVEQASTEMHALAAVLEKEHPDTNTDWDYLCVPLREYHGRECPRRVLICLARVCVLLDRQRQCRQLVARPGFIARRREMAVRLAIGAGRAASFGSC